MQLKSGLTEKNITFPDDGEMSPHEVLENIILYQMDANVEYKALASINGHIAFLCTISHNGRRTEGVGEVCLETLYNDVAKNYPIRMAAKRAFDYAAVRFLKIPLKEYKILVDWEERKERELQQAQEEQETQAKQDTPQSSQDTTNMDNSSNKSSANQHTESRPAPNIDYENVVVTIGRQKGRNWTVAQLAEKDLDSLKYVAYTYPEQVRNITEANQTVVDSCRRWLKEHGMEAAA